MITQINNNPLISVIVCFYNEEKFIKRCILSVINQSYKYLEIILINDGSTDLSLQIVENIISNYSNCVLINTKNQGLSISRNTGLEVVSGEYIVFLDGDDYLEPTMIESCFNKIITEKADLVIGKYKMLNEQNEIKKVGGWNDSVLIVDSHLDMAKKLFRNQIAVTVWAKMYASKLLKKIRFPNEQIWYEDTPFVLQCILESKKTIFLDKILINISINPNSITRRVVSEKRIIDFYKIFKIELAIVKQYNLLADLKNEITYHLINYFIDTICLYIIDYSKIIDKQKLLQTFKLHLQYLEKDIKEYSIHLGFKKYLKIKLLYLLRYGHFFIILFYIIFYKKIKRIKIIKGF